MSGIVISAVSAKSTEHDANLLTLTRVMIYPLRPHTTYMEDKCFSDASSFSEIMSFTRPSCPKPVWASFLCWTQKKIFWRMLVTKQLTVFIDVHSMEGKSMATSNRLVTNILQNIRHNVHFLWSIFLKRQKRACFILKIIEMISGPKWKVWYDPLSASLIRSLY